MADKVSNSEQASPRPISRTTLIAVAVFAVILIIGIFMIRKFFFSDPRKAGRSANVAEGNVGP